jgi:hypothetical protein
MRAVISASRKDLGGLKCPYTQNRVCGTTPCPRLHVDCQVTKWTEWDVCTHVCETDLKNYVGVNWYHMIRYAVVALKDGSVQ